MSPKTAVATPLRPTRMSRREQVVALLALLIWLGFQAWSLTGFPFVHSDEAWLSGLSLAQVNANTFRVTEPFFDRFPRQVHSMKLLFHALQGLLIRLLGYRLWSVRLLSLLASTLSLLLFQRHARVFLHPAVPQATLLTALLATHVQWLLASHLARQEILLFAILAGASLLYEQAGSKNLGWVGLLVFVGAFLHPNAFLLAAMLVAVVAKDVLTRREPPSALLLAGGLVVAAGLAHLLISSLLTPGFMRNYKAFGQTLQADAPLVQRGQNLLAYVVKLYQRVGGTYWLADLRVWLLVTGGLVLLATGVLLWGRGAAPQHRDGLATGLAQLAGFLAGSLVIGRYNPTSILFILYPFLRLLAHLLDLLADRPARWAKKGATGLLLLLLIGAGSQSLLAVRPFLTVWDQPYTHYLSAIRSSLPEEAVVLGNLSAYFGLADLPFFDIRNLDSLREEPEDDLDAAAVRRYLTENGINTVLWYSEYDWIMAQPMWRILYEDTSRDPGQPSTVFPALKHVLERDGTCVHTFDAPVYGTRVAAYMGRHPWKVMVYVLEPAGGE